MQVGETDAIFFLLQNHLDFLYWFPLLICGFWFESRCPQIILKCLVGFYVSINDFSFREHVCSIVEYIYQQDRNEIANGPYDCFH